MCSHVLDNQRSHGSSGHVNDGDADVTGVRAVYVLGGEGQRAVLLARGAADKDLGVVGRVDDLDAVGGDELFAIGQPSLVWSGFSGHVHVKAEGLTSAAPVLKKLFSLSSWK